jgi:hypothetical protein
LVWTRKSRGRRRGQISEQLNITSWNEIEFFGREKGELNHARIMVEMTQVVTMKFAICMRTKNIRDQWMREWARGSVAKIRSRMRKLDMRIESQPAYVCREIGVNAGEETWGVPNRKSCPRFAPVGDVVRLLNCMKRQSLPLYGFSK